MFNLVKPGLDLLIRFGKINGKKSNDNGKYDVIDQGIKPPSFYDQVKELLIEEKTGYYCPAVAEASNSGINAGMVNSGSKISIANTIPAMGL
ncbi:hypothetical protein [Pedobacter frigoris]|uniref:hypothetical protein n=1 Tax=Pedobacter frigoris TaxID=2571272 RepID=UPI001CECC19F|nr:hypothetical protein [Pedobacter frigoris]